MGTLLFHVPPRYQRSDGFLQRLHLSGLDDLPRDSRKRWSSDGLRIELESDDSAKLNVPWWIDGHGEVFLSTVSLMPRDRPYHLSLELARGLVHRIREHFCRVAPRLTGTENESFRDALTAIMSSFRDASFDQDVPQSADEKANAVVTRCLDLIGQIAAHDLEESIKAAKIKWIGARLPAVPGDDGRTDQLQWIKSFNMASIDVNWFDFSQPNDPATWDRIDRQLSLCRDNQMRTCVGPLIAFHGQLSSGPTPQPPDPGTLLQHAKSVLKRYSGQVSLWHCWSGLNQVTDDRLSEELRLRLAVATIELASQIDSASRLMVSINQPFGEYMANQPSDFAPIPFVESLIRADVPIGAIGLELNLGYPAGGTESRDMLAIGAHLDRWSLLGLPVFIFMTLPTGTEHWKSGGRPLHGAESQVTYAQRLMAIILAKDYVEGLIWNQATDQRLTAFPGGGLFDDEGRPRPSYQALCTFC